MGTFSQLTWPIGRYDQPTSQCSEYPPGLIDEAHRCSVEIVRTLLKDVRHIAE